MPEKSFFTVGEAYEIYNKWFKNGLRNTIYKSYKYCSCMTVKKEDKTYSIELIANHLILNIKDLLEHYAELIIIDFSGTAESCAETQAFLQS